jgi:hypothetical protein
MNKYSVEHEGHIYTRNTKRTYTHVVLVEGSTKKTDGTWAGSAELARKAAAALRRYTGDKKITIVEIPA